MVKETVKLISADGFEFLIDYKAACVSATVKNMLSSQGAARVCGNSHVPVSARCGSLAPRFTPSFLCCTVVAHAGCGMPTVCVSVESLLFWQFRQLHGDRAGRSEVPGDLYAHTRESVPVLLLQAAMGQRVSIFCHCHGRWRAFNRFL